MPCGQNRPPCMCLCPRQACHRPRSGVIPGKARRCPGQRPGLRPPFPPEPLPGPRPLVCSLRELKRLRSHGRVSRGFKGLSPGVSSRPGQRARPEAPRRQHLWPRSSLPRHGRCMPRPAGAHLPGSRAGSRVQEIPPKDASPGRLSRQEPRELTDTFPNKVPLSRGTVTGGREKSRSEARSNRLSAPERGRRSAGARKSDIRKDSESWTPRRALKEVALKAIPRSCHFLLNLAYELKVAAPGVSASRASHFLLL